MRDFTALRFEGTEMCRKFPQSAPEAKAALQRHGLQLASWWRGVRFANPDYREDELEAYRRHVDFLQAAGSRHVVTCEVLGAPHADPSAGERAVLTDEQWNHLAEGLHQAGEICRSAGMKLVYHYHAGTVVERPAEVAKLMELTDPSLVHLLLDTGHAIYGGGDPVQYAETYADRIAYVHLKDVRPDVLAASVKQRLGFLERVRRGVFTVPGDGCVDFGRVLNALDRTGYGGWLIMEAEQDPAVAEPFAYAAKGRAHLLECLAGGGARG